MVRLIIQLNIILVFTNILIGILSLNRLFHGKDLLPLLIGAIVIIIVFLSLFIKWKDFFKYRIIGFILVVLSSIGVIHAHFNIYSAEIEANSRSNALAFLENKEAPKLSHILSINYNNNTPLAELSKNNKFIILNFWGTWCPPCIKEMPLLNKFYEEYKGKGVEIIGFTDFKKSSEISVVQKEINKINNILEKLDINYPILIDDSQNVRSSYGAEVLPATVLINNEGKVIDYQIGIDGSLIIMQQVREKLLLAR